MDNLHSMSSQAMPSSVIFRRQGPGNNDDHRLVRRMHLLSTGQVRDPTKGRISRKASSV